MKDIAEELKNINKNFVDLIMIMKKQQKSRAEQIIDMTCAIVGVFGIISLIDIIKNWIVGG